MNLPADFRDAMIEAEQMSARGSYLEAERIYRTLASPGPHSEIALEALARLYLHQGRPDEAFHIYRELTVRDPDSLHFCGLLARFLDAAGRTRDASDEYQRLVARQPDNAVAHFNLALLLKKQQRNDEAMRAYEAALRHDIDQPEEVYSNMGVLFSEMQDAGKAAEMFQRAVDIDPEYVPALFNLAGHYEELGEKKPALELYERILSIDPNHWKSLARLAYPQKVSADNRGLVDRLTAQIENAGDDRRAKEGLYFALGKSYDDLELYDDATRAYVAANELSRQRVQTYTPAATEEAINRLMELFDANWVSRMATRSTVVPVFVCGMYRSGSTLLERMLGAHPKIAAGGELHVLAWLVNQHLGPFPQGVSGATEEQLQRVADEYEKTVSGMFPGADLVIDKRPDNFLRVGLIQALFPRAKIIQTRRHLLDNCLSLYFQQFDRAASYANDIGHIAHYYKEQERLFEHWRACSADSICSVDYEDLVESPEPVLRRVLDFLGLEWDPRVLEFDKSGGLVRTASIWQVRQGLHSASKGRWRHYESLLGDLVNDRSEAQT